MKKRPLKNVAASVRERLSMLRRESGRDYQGLMIQYALERLLHRLSVSSHRERFLLKGAMLFTIWQGAPHRMTRDLDLLGLGDASIGTLVEVFRGICVQSVQDDGMIFDAASVKGTEIRAEARYVGVRITLTALLDSARLPLQIDVGFGDDFRGVPDEVTMPSLLDMPAPQLRAYRRETVIAEKFEAMVTLGLQNSRLKDYFDLWFLGHRFAFDGAVLAASVVGTFARRQTRLPEGIPRGLTSQYSSDPAHLTAWNSFWRKTGIKEEKPSLEAVVQFIVEFLGPVIQAAGSSGKFRGTWAPGGPWQDGG
ncbi:MAG: nucleotidyl transferase AbiEii/AbiGii toxin family protein [Verrucomicrobiaceae bacterium]|nr:MAG: nucleotidyl transferase AbiEii/AbiGii toxin family protein [Verrucomicrobiaceae bacterium]